ncbi:MAG: hypothetical protein LBV40_03550 [Methanomicrobiales archaeon]|nr:hypothetical protein [Methanomicrobiales archaeon]
MRRQEPYTNKYSIIYIFIILILFCSTPVISDGTEAENAAAQISVANIVISPSLPFEDDIITVTVIIQNTGTQPVAISRAELYSKDLTVLNQRTYASVGTVGAGNTMEFTFSVRANAGDGIYYLWFYLDFRDAGSLQYHIPVTISNTPVVVSVTDMPTVFQENGEETITISVGNPRENTLNGVSVEISGSGITSTQNTRFIGTLPADESREVSCDLTAASSTDLLITTTYRTGTNEHMNELLIPITVGSGGKSASLIINNVELDAETTGYHKISGDVNNAGLKTAEAVVVTTDDPAVPIEPYRNYVIGSLNPDDFSSFDLTFTADDMSQIPVVVSYKDRSGSVFSETFTLDMSHAFEENRAARMPGPSPVVYVVLIVLIGAALYIAWKREYGPFKKLSRK